MRTRATVKDESVKLQYLVDSAEFSDWSGLHQLLKDCFAYMDGRIDPPSSLMRMTPDLLREKAGQETLVVALCNHELVACGFLRETDQTIYIGKLAVKQAFRRRGILKSILAIAEDVARQRRRTALELETRVELVENHKTFGALGFVKTGESSHDGYDRATSFTMKKPVQVRYDRAIRCNSDASA